MFWEQLIFAAALALDALATSVSYGLERIRVGVWQSVVVAAFGSGVLALAMLSSGLIGELVGETVCDVGSCALLIVLGAFTLIRGLLNRPDKPPLHRFQGHIGAVRIVLEICIDQTKADQDGSKTLSTGEALWLAAALSLDAFGAGLGWGANGSVLVTAGLAFLCTFLAMLLGCRVGGRFQRKRPLRLGWLTGAVLLVLGGTRLIGLF